MEQSSQPDIGLNDNDIGSENGVLARALIMRCKPQTPFPAIAVLGRMAT
jgi:hypothetical protein